MGFAWVILVASDAKDALKALWKS